MFYSPFSWDKGKNVSVLMKYPRSTFYMCESGILHRDSTQRPRSLKTLHSQKSEEKKTLSLRISNFMCPFISGRKFGIYTIVIKCIIFIDAIPHVNLHAKMLQPLENPTQCMLKQTHNMETNCGPGLSMCMTSSSPSLQRPASAIPIKIFFFKSLRRLCISINSCSRSTSLVPSISDFSTSWCN